MVKKINNILQRYLFSPELPFEGRVFNLVLGFGAVTEAVAMVIRLIQRANYFVVYAIIGMLLATCGCLLVCNKARRFRLGTWVTLVSICDIFFPMVFFSTGGINSGMAAYFVLCIVLIFFLLKGKGRVFMLASHLAVMVGCYLVGKIYPGLVIQFDSEIPVYIDSIHAIVVSGLLSGLLIAYQSMIYEEEKNKAEAASRAKANFLASVSHEIRTPMNAIIGLGELEMDKKLPADTLTNLEKMHNSAMSLLGIINDLLDISKIESGHFELLPLEYQTASFVNDTVNLNMVRIGSKPIVFRLDIDENLPVMLFGDELRLRQVLNNLLSNAFKYTNEGTVVLKIRCERFQEGEPVPYTPADKTEKLYMVCAVQDSGMGIREEDIGKLFSLYKQIDAGSHRHIEGTGLGLSICKNMTELMGGTVSVSSVFGKGSTFAVRIPQGIVDPQPLGRELVDNLAQFKFTAKKRERRKDILNPMPYGKVLVVDDVPTNLDVAKGMMMPYGLTIDCVESGPEAIAALREKKIVYDAVFMDHMMPGMNGIEAVRIIRNEIDSDYARTVPIIALTANALIGNDKMFLENGFNDFLTKPIDMTKLDVILNKWVRSYGKEQSPEWAGIIEQMKNGNDEPSSGAASSPPENAAGSGAVASPATPVIPGVDFAAGVKQMGGREATYIRVLTSFSEKMPALLDKLRNFKDETINDYMIAVHGVKGTCYGICANAAGAQAAALEAAAKSNDAETILAKNDGFIAQMEQLVEDISKHLAAK